MLRTLLASVLLALALAVIASPVSAARPIPATPSIVVNEAGPFAIGDPVTFTVVVPKLHGREYPLVYLVCTVDAAVVYGQLDLPTTTFILGGGSSPWIDPNDPDYRKPATCVGYLYSYPSVTLLSETAPFNVG